MKNDYVKCILDRPSFDSYFAYIYTYIVLLGILNQTKAIDSNDNARQRR